MNTRFDLASTSPRWTCTGNCESTTALLLRSPAAVGLILTAKAITRYPEFKSARFAEYVLIGTLLSVSMAFVGAVFLAWLARPAFPGSTQTPPVCCLQFPFAKISP